MAGDINFELQVFDHLQVTSGVCAFASAERQECFYLWGCATAADLGSG